jgi:hypothetical protein
MSAARLFRGEAREDILFHDVAVCHYFRFRGHVYEKVSTDKGRPWGCGEREIRTFAADDIVQVAK